MNIFPIFFFFSRSAMGTCLVFVHRVSYCLHTYSLVFTHLSTLLRPVIAHIAQRESIYETQVRKYFGSAIAAKTNFITSGDWSRGPHFFFFFIIPVNIWIKPTHSTAQNVCILRIASMAYVKFQCSWYTLLYIRRVHCCVRRISQAQCGRCWAVMSSYRDVYYVHLGYQFLWAEHHRSAQLTLSAVTGMASVTAKLLNNKIEKNSRRRPTKKKLYSQIHICKPMRIVVS